MSTVTPPSPRWPHVRAAFHAYARWLVSISWKRFCLLAFFFMIGASILKNVPPFSWQWGGSPEKVQVIHKKDIRIQPPVIKIETDSTSSAKPGEGIDISIDERGIRITPKAAASAASAGGTPLAAPAPGTDEPVVENPPSAAFTELRPKVMADAEKVERMRAYTMLGDNVADAYAGLMPKYGFKPLVSMLTQACDHGIESVPDAPPELVNFISAMEAKPDWVDMKLVEEGARLSREDAANYSPFVIRGAFIATFMNKYSALPMALTGTLSNATAARRVKDTASFFITSTLPGALERFGPRRGQLAERAVGHGAVPPALQRRPDDRRRLHRCLGSDRGGLAALLLGLRHRGGDGGGDHRRARSR